MAKKACICLHGFGENRLVYEPFAQEMRMFMETHTIDLVGHGENRASNYKVSQALQDIDEAIQKSDAEEIILVGTSFGGISSYIFASENQVKYIESRQRVIGLIINDVPCCVPAASFLNIANHLQALAENKYDNIDELDKKYKQNGFYEDRQPIPEALWENFLKVTLNDGEMNYDPLFIETILHPQHGIESISENVRFTELPDSEKTPVLDLRYYWQAINKPILLFRGERTTFFPTYVRGFMDANPKLTAVEIPAGGHFLDLSSELVMENINSWLLTAFNEQRDRIAAVGT